MNTFKRVNFTACESYLNKVVIENPIPQHDIISYSAYQFNKAVFLNHQIGKSNRECQLTLRTIMGDRNPKRMRVCECTQQALAASSETEHIHTL